MESPRAEAAVRVLGDFVLGEKLGEGGFGAVYRAEQRSLGRPAVIKMIRPSLVARRDATERFVLEARLASRLDHPYAAHVYAFGTEPDGTMWIAMELVNGTPMSELVERTGPIPLERFVPLLERLCEVVQSAHDQGIVHRDIKPSNVMVIGRAGRLIPKLLDFGIAKIVASAIAEAEPRRAKRSSVVGQIALEGTLDASGSAPATEQTATGSLTHAGQVLGSPPYMAPEQWVDAAQASARSDQYAIAMLAFEALTGERAFDAATIAELACAHTNDPLRALPPHLPAELNGVLARAAAKEPEARFATLTELAAAFRAAALGERAGGGAPLPALDPGLRATWLADAPRPLAETLATVIAARTPARIADRALAVAGLVARWIGVLAVACRSRLGRSRGATDADELIRALRRRTLRDLEWLELATALVTPFADRPAAWPMPELVEYLTGEAAEPLRELIRGDMALLDADDALARGRIDRLAHVLAGASWLLDYEVAREVHGGVELWMGLRGDEPTVCRSASRATGDVIVRDADGAPVVRLSPLVTIAAPAAGEPDEMFVFAGPTRAGDHGRACAHPRGFERDDDTVWPWLAAHVLDVPPETGTRLDGERSPYPGLAAFTLADRAAFVGRERDVEELLNRLRAQPVVAVVGPSGVGKTSFLAAGVVPALPASWDAVVLRPGGDPPAALAAAIDRFAGSPYRDGARTQPEPTAEALALALVRAAEQQSATLAVIVDQAEELFTMCSDDARRAAFADALVRAATHPGVRVVLGMRDDYLCRVEDLPAWRGALARGVQVLRVPARGDLERMLAVPARRFGYEFDDPTLPAAIVAEVADRPGALPLLAFAAAELWARRDRHFKRLARAAYEQIGGVTGALVQHADGVVDAMPAPDRRLVRRAFRRLLTVEGARALIDRSELVAALGGDAAASKVIDRLLAARLVVSRDDDDGERIEIIHETLVATWPRLAEWRREDVASQRIGEQLAAAARHWHERGRPPGLLWRGDALDDLRRWRRDGEPTTQTESAFVTASEAAARATRRRRVVAIASAFGVLAAGVVGLTWANRRISTQKTEAVDRLAAGYAERARLAVADGDPAQAALYLAEGARLGAHGAGFDLLASTADAALGPGAEIIAHQKSGVYFAAIDATSVLAVGTDRTGRLWSRGGGGMVALDFRDAVDAAFAGDLAFELARDQIAAFDRRGVVRWRASAPGVSDGLLASTAGGVVLGFTPGARLWDLDGHPRAALGPEAKITAAAIDDAGRLIALADRTGGVRVVRATDLGPVATCAAHGGAVSAVQFTPDAKLVVSSGSDRELHVCDAATGALVHRITGLRSQTEAIAISPDGATLAAGSHDGSAHTWQLATGALRATLAHGAAVGLVRFAPDGRLLATAATDGSVRIWDLDGTALGALAGHTARIKAAAWDGDSRHLVTTSLDGTIRRWDVDAALRAHVVVAHAGAINDLAIAPGDRFAVTGADDGKARVWERATRRLVATADAAAPVAWAAVAPDGATFTTVEQSGSAHVWSLPGAAPRALLGSDVTVAVYAGTAIVVGTKTGALRWLSTDGRVLGEVALGFAPAQLTPDPSGRWLVADPSWTGAAIAVIDLASRTIATRITNPARPARVAVGRTRLALTDGNAVRLIELGTWRPLARLEGHTSTVTDLWFLPDGSLLSSGLDAMLLAWAADGHLERSLPVAGDRVACVAATADGALFATAGVDGVVRVWETASKQRMLLLPGHRGITPYLKFTRDGAQLLSAGEDGHLIAWDVTHRTHSPRELAELVRCRVPLRLAGSIPVPRELDFDDPTCR